MKHLYKKSSQKCGKVYNPNSDFDVINESLPINLAEVTISVKDIKQASVLVNYSKNFAFSFFSSNPELKVVYRLSKKIADLVENLEEWTYQVTEVIPTSVQDIITVEPLVLNYCDTLNNNREQTITYIYQIVDLITDNTTLTILNQEISAIITNDFWF